MFRTGTEVRMACRNGSLSTPTSGLAPGYVQANLVILPYDWAYDFLLFAQRNPRACPVLEVGEAGSPYTSYLADSADVRTDLPKYRVYRNGKLEQELCEITELWHNQLVYFLIGCSFTFERALIDAGLPIRHIEEQRNVPMYRTSIRCRAAGRFGPSPMVVSMRPFTPENAVKAVAITRDFPQVHGAPVHLGDPAQIGIADLNSPDWGDPVTLYPGEIPVFWACGVTPQLAALTSRVPLMITHAPGHMFVGDLKDDCLRY